MDDTTKTILIAAGSGTIGAAITQISSLINNYYSDRRKYQAEQNKVLILRKIEVGEHAVHHLGLVIQMMRKFVSFLENAPKFTTDEAYKKYIDFIDSQKAAVVESESKNTLVNFIPIYFDVETSFAQSAIRDSKINDLNAESAELMAKATTDPDNSAQYINRLTEIRHELIAAYYATIKILEQDYDTIVAEVRRLVTSVI